MHFMLCDGQDVDDELVKRCRVGHNNNSTKILPQRLHRLRPLMGRQQTAFLFVLPVGCHKPLPIFLVRVRLPLVTVGLPSSSTSGVCIEAD